MGKPVQPSPQELAPSPAPPRVPIRRRMPLGRILIFAVLAAVSASTIYPLIFVLKTSLKTEDEYIANPYGWPREPSMGNFQNVWSGGASGGLSRYALNSTIVVVSGVLLSWAVCGMAGYAFSHLRFRGRRALFFVVLGSMMIAPQVIIIPLYAMLAQIGLLNKHIGLILVYVTLATPFGTYLMTSYLKGVPRELVEAAQVDGANHLQILLRVMLPVARPALITLGIFNFLWMWNELLFALLILQEDSRTLIVRVATLQGEYTAHIPHISAALFLAALPVLTVFLIFQTQLQKGMTLGAVK
jgi:multiple sugar transport system permease protein